MPAYPTAESPKRPRRNPERLCCVAVRVNPGATLPRALLSRLPVKRGYLDRASREFEAALKIQPDEAPPARPSAPKSCSPRKSQGRKPFRKWLRAT